MVPEGQPLMRELEMVLEVQQELELELELELVPVRRLAQVMIAESWSLLAV